MNVPFLDLSRAHRALRDEMLAAFAATYDANRFCLGADVEAFEREFAAASGATDAVAVNNGTSALHLAARGLGLGPGDDVIVPAFTFIASAWTASYVGARPVFCDIDPRTFTVTADTIAAALTPATRAIVVVHVGSGVAGVAGEVPAARVEAGRWAALAYRGRVGSGAGA